MLRFSLLTAFLCASLLTGPIISFATASEAELALTYRIRFEGAPDRSILRDLRQVSDMVALRDRPPVTERQLRRRAERDVEQFLRVLRTHGFYDATVSVDIRPDRSPVRVRFRINAGPVYTLRRIVVVQDDSECDTLRAASGLSSGDPARAGPIVAAEERLVRALDDRGYPYARVIRREVHIAREVRALDVTYVMETGPQAVFGDTRIVGLTSVRESFVRGKLPWRPGDPFDGAHLRRAQRRVSGSDLFTTVRFVRAEELDNGTLPLQLEVMERKHRSVSLGVGYRSDEGARVRAGWEHRNLAGAGERLSINTALSEIGYSGEGRLQKPDLFRVDQTLTLTLRAALDEPDAYRSRNYGLLTSIDRLVQPGMTVGAGIGFKYASVRQDRIDEDFGLLYFPLRVDLDRSDDLLHPRRGYRLGAGLAPYRDMIHTEVAFFKARLTLTGYRRILRRPEVIWANRFTAATLTGASRDAVPADERYYAGGGGTVRGYAYQSVGPLDGKTPLGGRSLGLLSSEIRWRISRDFGLAAFVDGGTAYESTVPDGMDDFLWGVGCGIRYFTPVGPLRFDLAFPMDRRKEVDDAYQFYISLGQAF